MEISQPWDGVAVNDATRAPYSADEWDDMFEALFNSGGTWHQNFGVLSGFLQELEVAGAPTTPVSVAAGAALVKGKWYRNDAGLSIAVTSPTVSTRVDYIALECDWTGGGVYGLAFTIRAVLLQGVEGAGVPPALVQTDGTLWQIPLAILSTTTGGVITITDDRHWLMTQHHRYKALGMNEALVQDAGVVQLLAYTAHNAVLQWNPAVRGYAAWQKSISDWDEERDMYVRFKTRNNTVGAGDGNPTVWHLFASQWPDHCDVSGTYAVSVELPRTIAGVADTHIAEVYFTLTYAQGFRRERVLHLTLTREYGDPGDTSADTWVTLDGRLEYRA